MKEVRAISRFPTSGGPHMPRGLQPARTILESRIAGGNPVSLIVDSPERKKDVPLPGGARLP